MRHSNIDTLKNIGVFLLLWLPTLAFGVDLVDLGSGSTGAGQKVVEEGQFWLKAVIWAIGIILVFMVVWYAGSAFVGWRKNKNDIGDLLATILVGLVIIIMGVWLLGLALTSVESGV